MNRSMADIRERVLRRRDWAFPPEPVDLEIVRQVPEHKTDKPPILLVHALGHAAWTFAEHWMPALAALGWPSYASACAATAKAAGRRARSA